MYLANVESVIWTHFAVLSFTTEICLFFRTEPTIHPLKGVCTDGYFQCVNDTSCVHQNSQCNGEVDCPSGSDEMGCDDQHDEDYWNHLFRKNPSAEHDDLDDSCALAYNGSCVCRSKDLLCQHKGYVEAPKNIPVEFIDILDFTGNNFKILEPKSVENIPDNIATLSMVHCNVQEIFPKTFHHLQKMQYLHLDNNHLKFLPDNIFGRKSNLIKLFLMYNDIRKVHVKAFENLENLIELDLRGNKLEKIRENVFQPLHNLRHLFLQNNKIKHIDVGSFPELPLIKLSITDNKITEIEVGAFSKLKSLQYLFLSNNDLRKLKNKTFENLTSLESLTLNDNFIADVEDEALKDVPNLVSLKLERNHFRSLNKKVLSYLTKLGNIYFDRFDMCSSATHVRVCHPHGDGISSHEHLLENPILRICVWLMASVSCTGNLLVLLGRFLAPTNNVVHSLYLRNLALSDLLMGIYLFVIASVDEYYRGVYLKYQYTWRHSHLCNLCGFLSTLSCESSVLILSLVTWDRFVSVTQPLARRQSSPKTAALTLLALWCSAALVALLPVLSATETYFGDEFYGNNGVCLSLHIHEPFSMGWEYSVAVFVMVNALALVFICFAYVRMAAEIRASGVACRSTRQSSERDKVAQRFGIIVLTDCLCWVPVIVVKLTALAGLPRPPNLYAWLAIFVLPINSALNPVLYTLTTSVFKKQMRKIANSCVSTKRSENNHHSASESAFSLSLGVFPIGGANRRVLSYRGTQSSLTTSKSSWKRSTAV